MVHWSRAFFKSTLQSRSTILSEEQGEPYSHQTATATVCPATPIDSGALSQGLYGNFPDRISIGFLSALAPAEAPPADSCIGDLQNLNMQ